ncbi:MAG TPA: DUF4129 domain-containing protein [Mycobacteriales bacterium]|nr:DUF4129 domain-containing protein [Mycobacteriales bacterium]
MTPVPPITRAGAQHAARHELSKAIYHQQRDPLLVRAVKAVGHWLSSVLTHVGTGSAGGALALAVLVVLALLIGFVIWRRVGPLRRSAVAPGAVLSNDRTLSAAEHRALAVAAADRGDHETAVLEQMRAVVRALEERGVIEPRAGRTALEVAREAGRGMPAASPLLDAAAGTFNDVVYGGGTAGPHQLETLREADRAVSAGARRRSR